MDPASYKLAWQLYIGAGIVFSLLSGWVLWRYLWRELAYLLQCLLMAVIFVPAPVTTGDSSILAPALIVFTLDTVTIGRTATAGIEALTRLTVGAAGAVIAAIVLGVLHRVLFRSRQPQPAVVKAPVENPPVKNVRAEPTLSPPNPTRRSPQGAASSTPLSKRPQNPV